MKPTSRRTFFRSLIGFVGGGAILVWWQKSNLLSWIVRRDHGKNFNLTAVTEID